MQKPRPNISKTAFWDVNFEEIDFDKNTRDVINRVLMNGKLSDWKEINSYYGIEKIKEEVVQMRYLSNITLNFCSFYYQIPNEEFRCYTLKQSIPKLWDF
ncbi:DUF6922 domain-containing protein [Emticicia sp. SJ17W-69]|uniref:DUF6922 domain-containing protein n=1 Tax=Emticicia sp. SJ17W-69 TaxID=3421657 RepID=UPI003EBBF122